VADQRADPDSLLNWFVRAIRARKECPEFGTREFSVVGTGSRSVLGLRFDAPSGTVVVHNLSDQPRVRLRFGEGERAVEWFADQPNGEVGRAFELAPYGFRWLRT